MSKQYWAKLLTCYAKVLNETGNREEAFNYAAEDFDLDHGEAFDLWNELNAMEQNIPEDVHALKSFSKSLQPSVDANTEGSASAGKASNKRQKNLVFRR
jgi:hypothetical protein